MDRPRRNAVSIAYFRDIIKENRDAARKGGTMPEPGISKMTKGQDGYFTVTWSEFKKADRWSIKNAVPAMGGVAELYWMDDHKKLNIFCVTRSWYGGLRSNLRELTDPEIERDPERLAILLEHKDAIYYRYTLTDSLDDMNDVVFYLSEVHAPGAHKVKSSGRYERIFVNEIDAGKLVTI